VIIDLIRRLRGEYRIPITDGLGPAGGAEPDNATEFVRHFPSPPIQKEAAEALEKALDFKTETLKLLKKIEWSATERGPGWGYMGSGGDGPSYAACPSCGGLEKSNPDFNKRSVGHRSRCKIKLLLDKAKEFDGEHNE